MSEQERARGLAEEWQASQPDLQGLDPHLVEFGGYWWATFRPPGATRPSLGGVGLLIDLAREIVSPGPSYKSPDEQIADYEASLPKR